MDEKKIHSDMVSDENMMFPDKKTMGAEEAFATNKKKEYSGTVEMNRFIRDVQDFIDSYVRDPNFEIERDRAYSFFTEDLKNLDMTHFEKTPFLNFSGLIVNVLKLREDAIKELKRVAGFVRERIEYESLLSAKMEKEMVPVAKMMRLAHDEEKTGAENFEYGIIVDSTIRMISKNFLARIKQIEMMAARRLIDEFSLSYNSTESAVKMMIDGFPDTMHRVRI